MALPQIYTGSWEELTAQSGNFKGRGKITLIVPGEEAEVAGSVREHFYYTATPEQFQEVFDALACGHENSSVLPNL